MNQENNTNNIGTLIKKLSPAFIFIGLFIIMSVASPAFTKFASLMNVLRQSAVVGILAIGQAMVIMSGGIDLSIGAMMALSGCLTAILNTKLGFAPVPAVICGICVGMVIGLINGLLTTKLNLFDFIATLGTQMVANGIALVITQGLPVSRIDGKILFLGATMFGPGIPYSCIVLLIIVVLGWILLEKTTFGRNVLAIGGNREAARVSGINTDNTKILANVFAGLCAAIAGIVLSGRLSSANALMGTNYELNSIAAVVIGGTSINGGEGSIIGTLLGILTMGVLQCGMDLLGFSAAWQKIVLGLVIIAVVTLDNFRRKKAAQH